MKWKKLLEKWNILTNGKKRSKEPQGEEGSHSRNLQPTQEPPSYSGLPWNNIGYHPDHEQKNFYYWYARIGKKTICRNCREHVEDWNWCDKCEEAIPKPGTNWPAVPYS